MGLLKFIFSLLIVLPLAYAGLLMLRTLSKAATKEFQESARMEAEADEYEDERRREAENRLRERRARAEKGSRRRGRPRGR